MEEVRIRHGRRSDERFIGTLARECFAEYGTRPVQTTVSMSRRGVPLIAEAGTLSLGFAILEFPHQRLAQLGAIAVEYTWRGRGVGRQLLRAAEHFASGRGATTLELHTADSNLAALDLFFKTGFQLRQRREGYYAHGQAGCTLAKSLRLPA